MQANLILTIILDILAFISIIKAVPNVQGIGGIITFTIVVVTYIFFFVTFALLNVKEDWNTELGPLQEQINALTNVNIAKMVANIFVCYLHYIYTMIVLTASNFLNDFVKVGIIILIAVLLIFRVIYIAAKQSPIIVLIGVSVVLLIFSLIGINDAVLSWTFVMLIFGTVYIQFTNIDVKYLLPKDYRDKVINNEESEEIVKENLLKKKYSVLLFIPFLYITLLISEQIVKSKNFMFFVNCIASSHYVDLPSNFFSLFTIYAGILKLILFISILMLYYQYKDMLLDLLSKVLIRKSAGSENLIIENGRYYKAILSEISFKKFKRKWEIDKSNYVSIDKNYIVEYQLNNQTDSSSPLIAIKCWSSISKNKKLKFITNDIVQIDSNYFVKDNSDIINKLKGADKFYGNSLLRKINHSVIYVFLIILAFFTIMYFGTDYGMKNSFRGIYYLSGSKKFTEDKKQEFIIFSGEEVKVIKRNSRYYNADTVTKYKYDNSSLLIKDSNDTIVGGVDISTKSILMYYDNLDKPQEYKK